MKSALIKLPNEGSLRIYVEGSHIKTSLSLPMVGHDYGSAFNAERAFDRWLMRTAKSAEKIEVQR